MAAWEEDLATRLAHLDRGPGSIKESSIFDIAKGISTKLYTELSGQGAGVNYNALRYFDEIREQDIQPINEFPSDREKFISVTGVGERIEYQPGGVTHKFADIQIRVFLSDSGGHVEDKSEEERVSNTMRKMLGLVSDILDVIETNAQSIPIPYETRSYFSYEDDPPIPPDFNRDDGVYRPVMYWVEEGTEYAVLSPDGEDTRKTLLKYNSGEEKWERVPQQGAVVYNTWETWPSILPEGPPEGYIRGREKKISTRVTQDILVTQVTTDEGLLAPEGLAAGEISIEVRYQ